MKAPVEQTMLVRCILGAVAAVGLINGLSVDLAKNVKEAESLLESLKELDERLKNDDEQMSSVYEKRNDVFEDLRWQSVFVSSDQDEMLSDKRMHGITSQQKEDILELHNKLRKQEGSSNMFKLHWNDQLAKLGQTWSERCVFEHGQPPFTAASTGHKELGQNIFAHTDPKFNVKQAVQAWYDEKKDYHYSSLSCNAGAVCGHYTAVTWAKTKEVGCGMAFCPSISGLSKAHFIVCNYGPAGNWGGEKPFLKGSPCTQCDNGKFFCNNGLCDATCSGESASCVCKASCKHCGEKKACGCVCRPGWTGPDCSEECQDKDPKCGKNPGYPQMVCAFNDPAWAFVKDKCPKLCGTCQPSDGKPCNQRDDDSRRSSLDKLIGYLAEEHDE